EDMPEDFDTHVLREVIPGDVAEPVADGVGNLQFIELGIFLEEASIQRGESENTISLVHTAKHAGQGAPAGPTGIVRIPGVDGPNQGLAGDERSIFGKRA